MSDLTATNCGSGCNGGFGGNGCGNLIFLILLLTCCGNGSGILGGGDCGCGGSGMFGDNNCLWILLLLFFCGGCGCGC